VRNRSCLLSVALFLLCSGCVTSYQDQGGNWNTVMFPAPNGNFDVVLVNRGKVPERVYVESLGGAYCASDINRSAFIVPPGGEPSKFPNDRFLHFYWYDLGDCCYINRQVKLVSWPFDPKTGQTYGKRESFSVSLGFGQSPQEIFLDPNTKP
jgi:hypothetical protein